MMRNSCKSWTYKKSQYREDEAVNRFLTRIFLSITAGHTWVVNEISSWLRQDSGRCPPCGTIQIHDEQKYVNEIERVRD